MKIRQIITLGLLLNLLWSLTPAGSFPAYSFELAKRSSVVTGDVSDQALSTKDQEFSKRSQIWEKSSPPVETKPNPTITSEVNSQAVPKKDQEFSDRSRVAKKWVFKEIPRDLGLSLKESFWGWGALGFAGGIGLTAALHPLDDDVKNGLGPDQLFSNTANEAIGWTFSPYTYGGISLILWIVGHNTRHKKLGLTGRALTEAIALSMGITLVTKFAFRRERPDGGSLSFPSAHTTSAFAAAGVLTTFYGWKGALPSYAAALLVSLNRLDDHKHWLSDVVMGAVIGSVVGIGTARFLKRDHPKFFIIPQMGREHATLNFHYPF